MPDLDLSKLSLNMAPTLDFISDMQREQDNAMRALEATRRAKEQEELRRHNELVSALREAGEKGATIIIGDHAGDIQIQQNSAGAKQKDQGYADRRAQAYQGDRGRCALCGRGD